MHPSISMQVLEFASSTAGSNLRAYDEGSKFQCFKLLEQIFGGLVAV